MFVSLTEIFKIKSSSQPEHLNNLKMYNNIGLAYEIWGINSIGGILKEFGIKKNSNNFIVDLSFANGQTIDVIGEETIDGFWQVGNSENGTYFLSEIYFAIKENSYKIVTIFNNDGTIKYWFLFNVKTSVLDCAYIASLNSFLALNNNSYALFSPDGQINFDTNLNKTTFNQTIEMTNWVGEINIEKDYQISMKSGQIEFSSSDNNYNFSIGISKNILQITTKNNQITSQITNNQIIYDVNGNDFSLNNSTLNNGGAPDYWNNNWTWPIKSYLDKPYNWPVYWWFNPNFLPPSGYLSGNVYPEGILSNWPGIWAFDVNNLPPSYWNTTWHWPALSVQILGSEPTGWPSNWTYDPNNLPPNYWNENWVWNGQNTIKPNGWNEKWIFNINNLPPNYWKSEWNWPTLSTGAMPENWPFLVWIGDYIPKDNEVLKGAFFYNNIVPGSWPSIWGDYETNVGQIPSYWQTNWPWPVSKQTDGLNGWAKNIWFNWSFLPSLSEYIMKSWPTVKPSNWPLSWEFNLNYMPPNYWDQSWIWSNNSSTMLNANLAGWNSGVWRHYLFTPTVTQYLSNQWPINQADVQNWPSNWVFDVDNLPPSYWNINWMWPLNLKSSNLLDIKNLLSSKNLNFWIDCLPTTAEFLSGNFATTTAPVNWPSNWVFNINNLPPYFWSKNVSWTANGADLTKETEPNGWPSNIWFNASVYPSLSDFVNCSNNGQNWPQSQPVNWPSEWIFNINNLPPRYWQSNTSWPSSDVQPSWWDENLFYNPLFLPEENQYFSGIKWPLVQRDVLNWPINWTFNANYLPPSYWNSSWNWSENSTLIPINWPTNIWFHPEFLPNATIFSAGNPWPLNVENFSQETDNRVSWPITWGNGDNAINSGNMPPEYWQTNWIWTATETILPEPTNWPSNIWFNQSFLPTANTFQLTTNWPQVQTDVTNWPTNWVFDNTFLPLNYWQDTWNWNNASNIWNMDKPSNWPENMWFCGLVLPDISDYLNCVNNSSIIWPTVQPNNWSTNWIFPVTSGSPLPPSKIQSDDFWFRENNFQYLPSFVVHKVPSAGTTFSLDNFAIFFQDSVNGNLKRVSLDSFFSENTLSQSVGVNNIINSYKSYDLTNFLQPNENTKMNNSIQLKISLTNNLQYNQFNNDGSITIQNFYIYNILFDDNGKNFGAILIYDNSNSLLSAINFNLDSNNIWQVISTFNWDAFSSEYKFTYYNKSTQNLCNLCNFQNYGSDVIADLKNLNKVNNYIGQDSLIYRNLENSGFFGLKINCLDVSNSLVVSANKNTDGSIYSGFYNLFDIRSTIFCRPLFLNNQINRKGVSFGFIDNYSNTLITSNYKVFKFLLVNDSDQSFLNIYNNQGQDNFKEINGNSITCGALSAYPLTNSIDSTKTVAPLLNNFYLYKDFEFLSSNSIILNDSNLLALDSITLSNVQNGTDNDTLNDILEQINLDDL